jgi:hypothetical protein
MPSDIEAMTKLHCESFHSDEAVPVMFGLRYVKATYRRLVTRPRSYAQAAETRERIMGFVAVCDGPFTRPAFIACLGEYSFSLARKPFILLKRQS